MLTVPPYIELSGVVASPIKHEWNDHDHVRYYRGDERLANRFNKICRRGNVALSAGFAEWIARRLSGTDVDRVLLQAIEAVWAGIVDWRYLKPLGEQTAAPDWDDCKGPVRGPICGAFNLLAMIVISGRKGSYCSADASSLSQLAEHVVPKAKSFKDWRRAAVERLTLLYPKPYPHPELSVVGPPIPREALDPAFDYKPETANELIAAYLETLDYKQNPFLRSPKEMITEGFEGTPYTL